MFDQGQDKPCCQAAVHGLGNEPPLRGIRGSSVLGKDPPVLNGLPDRRLVLILDFFLCCSAARMQHPPSCIVF